MILNLIECQTQKKLKLNADQKYNKYYWFTSFFLTKKKLPKLTRYYTHPNIRRYLFTKTIDGLVRGIRITDILVSHSHEQTANQIFLYGFFIKRYFLQAF